MFEKQELTSIVSSTNWQMREENAGTIASNTSRNPSDCASGLACPPLTRQQLHVRRHNLQDLAPLFRKQIHNRNRSSSGLGPGGQYPLGSNGCCQGERHCMETECRHSMERAARQYGRSVPRCLAALTRHAERQFEVSVDFNSPSGSTAQV